MPEDQSGQVTRLIWHDCVDRWRQKRKVPFEIDIPQTERL